MDAWTRPILATAATVGGAEAIIRAVLESTGPIPSALAAVLLALAALLWERVRRLRAEAVPPAPYTPAQLDAAVRLLDGAILPRTQRPAGQRGHVYVAGVVHQLRRERPDLPAEVWWDAVRERQRRRRAADQPAADDDTEDEEAQA